MMAAAAFTQAQSSLRWFVDNFQPSSQTGERRLLRVASFPARRDDRLRRAARSSRAGITYSEGEPGTVTIEDFEIVSPARLCDMLKEKNIVINSRRTHPHRGRPRERAKPVLFSSARWIVAVWARDVFTPTPKMKRCFICPAARLIFPAGRCVRFSAYPLKVPMGFADDAFRHALSRLGLDRIVPMLDVTNRWDRELSQDEQLCLAFARITLQKPRWAIIG